MSTYGVIVEGAYDEAVLTEMIKKFLPTDTRIVPRTCRGKDTLMKVFPSHLESFRYEKQGTHVDKAIVIRDAHGKDPEELKARMSYKIENRNYPFEVKFIIIVQELEAWLLADEAAISKVTQSRSGKSIVRVNELLESVDQPKELLYRILSEVGVYYTEAVAREIAKECDFQKLGYRCPRFKEFGQAVKDC